MRRAFNVLALLAFVVPVLTSGCATDMTRVELLEAQFDSLTRALQNRDEQVQSLAAELASLKAKRPTENIEKLTRQLADLKDKAQSLEDLVAQAPAARESLSAATKKAAAASEVARLLVTKVQGIEGLQELVDDIAGLVSSRDKFTAMVASVEQEHARLSEKVPGTLRARRIEVVDERGTPRITLSASDSWGRIYVFNDAGNVVAGVSSDAEGNGLILTNDRSGNHQLTRISASMGNGSGSTSGTFSTWNTHGQRVAELFAFDSGGGGVATYLRGKLTTKMGDPLAGPGGSVVVYSKTGEAVATMGVDDDGDGRVAVWDRSGKGRKLTPWKP